MGLSPRILLALLFVQCITAADFTVSSLSELESALAGATAGTTITVAAGTVDLNTRRLTCSADGTSSQPIVVRGAGALGDAKLKMHQSSNYVEGFVVTGKHWIFENLDIEGTCADHSYCEHAWHVQGDADFFTLRGNRAYNFNAMLKVNIGSGLFPDDGLVELNELYNTAARSTSNPVTPLNIDGGRRWVVRDNYIHDAIKGAGNGVSYQAFMKSNGRDGVFERNIVRCAADLSPSGYQIGLSFGGGGTSPDSVCEDGSCFPEHQGGVMRNNIIVDCNDVAIYINEGSNCAIYHNTIYNCAGVDVRFDGSTVAAYNNILTGNLRERDSGVISGQGGNIISSNGAMDGIYTSPSSLDFSAQDAASLIGAGVTIPSPVGGTVTTDYCSNTRTSNDVGALSFGSSGFTQCDTSAIGGGAPSGGSTGTTGGSSTTGTTTGGGGGTTTGGGGSSGDPCSGGAVISSSSGSIEYPTESEYYSEDLDCRWTVDAGQPIRMTVTYLDTEGSYDYLWAYDGSVSSTNRLLRTSGASLPSSFYSSGDSMTVRFTSDGGTAGTGFVVSWAPATPPSGGAVSGDACGSGATLTGDYGVVRYPASGDYPNNAECTWLVDAGAPAVISFTYFDTEAGYDYVKVYDGPTTSAPLLLDYAGGSLPSSLSPSSSQALVRFTSDTGLALSGFVFHWSTGGSGGGGPSCDDGIMNQDETAIDCGGVCAPCAAFPTCSDGMRNQGELGIDCGGPCPECPCTPLTCAAWGLNCGDLSDGCGGTLSCGTCTAPDTCGGGGTSNVCGTPSGGGTTGCATDNTAISVIFSVDLSIPPTDFQTSTFINDITTVLDIPESALVAVDVLLDQSTASATRVRFTLANVLLPDGCNRVDIVAVALRLQALTTGTASASELAEFRSTSLSSMVVVSNVAGPGESTSTTGEEDTNVSGASPTCAVATFGLAAIAFVVAA